MLGPSSPPLTQQLDVPPPPSALEPTSALRQPNAHRLVLPSAQIGARLRPACSAALKMLRFSSRNIRRCEDDEEQMGEEHQPNVEILQEESLMFCSS